MSELKIRGLSEETIVKLTHEAKKRGISREELLRKILENFSVAPTLLQQEEKYKSLLKMIAEVLTLNTQTIQEFRNILQKGLKQIAKECHLNVLTIYRALYRLRERVERANVLPQQF